ncbi:MAG: response regulator, partial [Acetivibrio ethanolgignens]
MRLLLAEDERDLNHILTKRLTNDGYSVDSCFNGEEALEFLNVAEYDAVILDIMMPKVDGLEVLKRIRSAGKDTPVIFLTAKDAIEDRVLGLDSGAHDYLVKPF